MLLPQDMMVGLYISNYKTMIPSPRSAWVISRSPHEVPTYTGNLVDKVQAPVMHHGFPLRDISAVNTV